jgi:hypothetical protein
MTFLRAQVFYGAKNTLTSPLNASVEADADSAVVRTVPFEITVAAGLMQGFEINKKFGRNEDIDTDSEPEDIWHGGGPYTGQPTSGSAETVTVVSDNANDTAGGTGS